MPGSKPGERRGGRKKGAKNKATIALNDELIASGELPKFYMLRIMRDRTADNDRRDRMAVSAAPFFHSRLNAVEHSGPDGGPIKTEEVVDRTDLARRLAFLLTSATKS